MSSRRQERRLAVDILFQADVTGNDARIVLAERADAGLDVPAFSRELVAGVVASLPGIDRTIGDHAEGWSVERMASVDRAVLRVATYELLEGRTPVGAVIDEAVRAAKELSTEDSGRFVNGVLGMIARDLERNDA